MSGPYMSGSTQPSEIICPNCDGRNAPGMSFCGRCGTSLVGASATMLGTYPPQQPPQPHPYYPPPPPYDRPEQSSQGAYAMPPPPAQMPYYPYAQPPVAAVNQPRKSLLLSFFLTLFFGPLGLFYATVVGAIIMVVVSVVAATLFFVLIVGRLTEYVPIGTSSGVTWVTLAAIGIWLALVLASAVWGAVAISAQNNKPPATLAR